METANKSGDVRRPIFLIGFMGSGKTTLCNALVNRYGLRAADLDEYIEHRAGMTIKEYFNRYGEEAFRRFEHESLALLADEAPDLIACGGGTPCFHDNMALMASLGTTVYLDAPHSSLLRRLGEARAKRPLIAALNDDELSDFIKNKLDDRMRFYSLANYSFDSSRLETEDEIDASCAIFSDRFLKP